MPFHTDKLIDRLAKALGEVWKRLEQPFEANVVALAKNAALRPAA
jgi:hypothetical protein